jgi:hypothetical protein
VYLYHRALCTAADMYPAPCGLFRLDLPRVAWRWFARARSVTSIRGFVVMLPFLGTALLSRSPAGRVDRIDELYLNLTV